MIYPAYQWGGGYSKSEVDTLLNDYIPKVGGGVISGTTFNRTVNDSSVTLCGGTDLDGGASITLSGKDRTNDNGDVIIRTKDNSNVSDLVLRPNGTATWTNKNLAMQEDTIPRSGGSVMMGSLLGRTTSTAEFRIDGGNGWGNGGSVLCYGKDRTGNNGGVLFHPSNGSVYKFMIMYPNGTWTWDGTAVQLTSDQRYKQQITQIDNALLDAWQDVDLVQFKYNDAVDQKGKDKARLHTGYVVQQINKACQKHNIDISEYGLYCHEEYPERTEEVTIENEDGTTSKETKVIEPAKEHYSLRYTETLVVECAYLRRENARLKERLQSHDEYFSNIEKRLQSLENS